MPPSARKDPFGFGVPEAASVPRPAPAPSPPAPARQAGLDSDDWSDVAAEVAPAAAAKALAPAPLEPIDLGPDVAEEAELAPMHEFVPPAASTGHAPEAVVAPIAPARAAPAPAPSPAADGGEAALRAALTGASREVIERIAWEVVPQLAETIIRENLEKLVKGRKG